MVPSSFTFIARSCFARLSLRRPLAALVATATVAGALAGCAIRVRDHDDAGCDDDVCWDHDDDGRRPGATASCRPGAPCELDCVAGGCDLDCSEASSCDVDCVAGGCEVTCGPGEACVVDCVGGGCDVDCGGADVCDVDCVGGSCDVTCRGADTCDVDCVAGSCDVGR